MNTTRVEIERVRAVDFLKKKSPAAARGGLGAGGVGVSPTVKHRKKRSDDRRRARAGRA